MTEDHAGEPARTGPISGRDGRPRRGGQGFRLLLGVIFILVGAWFFVERTLGIDLPRIPWRDLWPVFLIALGAWIAFRGASRRDT